MLHPSRLGCLVLLAFFVQVGLSACDDESDGDGDADSDVDADTDADVDSDVDAANPASMQVVSRYETALPAVRFARAGEHLAVAVDSGGMEILDVSDPAHPRQFATAR